MSYVSGHYRKGHYRNGRWVSGGYVKSHYRSGYGYGSVWSPINTTVTEQSPKDSNDSQSVHHVDSQKESDMLCTEKLTGEAYLNSRRKYWRKERAKSPASQLKMSKDEDTDWTTTWGIIIGVVIVIGIFILIASGGPEVMNWFLAIMVIGALLKKG